MRKTILMALVATFTLVGCAYTTDTEKATRQAKESISSIKKSLPKECQTDIIQIQIQNLEKEIQQIESSCAAEKKLLESQKGKWVLAFFGLLATVIAYVLAKIGGKL